MALELLCFFIITNNCIVLHVLQLLEIFRINVKPEAKEQHQGVYLL